MKKRALTLLMLGVMGVSMLSGCGSKGDDYSRDRSGSSYKMADTYDTDYYEEEYYEVASSMADTEALYDYEGDYAMSDAKSYSNASKGEGAPASTTDDTIVREDKMVYEADLTIETLEFDETYDKLMELVKECGGRVENEQYDAQYSSYTRNDNYRDGYHTTKKDYLVIRIPAANYDKFMSADATLGNVTGKTQSLDNISQQYYSTETKVELLEGQLEYYKHQLELIEEKLMDCEDYDYVIGQMIELEDRIISVQNEINQYKNSIVTMDNQVEYSTIYLTLTEVKEYTDITPVKEEEPDTFGNRFKDNLKKAWESFCGFLENVLYGLMFALPYIIIAAVVVVICVLAVKKSSKKKAKKNAKGVAVTPVINQPMEQPTLEMTTENNVEANVEANDNAEAEDEQK